MTLEFLLGNKQTFLDFLNSISEKDGIAILTHTDLDGISSAIFTQEILRNKGFQIKYLDFLEYRKEMFDNLFEKLLKENINKIFLTDLAADQTAPEGFAKLREKFDCLLIDHHPVNYDLENKENIIKTKTEDCAGFVLYSLGEGLFDRKKWEDLVCATLISDVSYRKEENLEFIRKIYPEINRENIISSEPSELSKIISSALIYFKNNLRKVYDFVEKRNFNELNRYRKIIDSEIEKSIRDFKKDADFFPKQDLYFYLGKPKYSITSIVTSLLSFEEPDKTFVYVSESDDNFFKVSARNQNGKTDMNHLMKKGISRLENATGGGHVPAAGARIMKKDLEKFKENILNA